MKDASWLTIKCYLKASVIALVADVGDHVRTNIRVANHTHSIVFLAQSSQRDARLLSAEHKIRVVLRHYEDEQLECKSEM